MQRKKTKAFYRLSCPLNSGPENTVFVFHAAQNSVKWDEQFYICRNENVFTLFC